MDADHQQNMKGETMQRAEAPMADEIQLERSSDTPICTTCVGRTTHVCPVTTEGEIGTWHEREAVDEAIPAWPGRDPAYPPVNRASKGDGRC
jgi:hypothetical protein